VSPRRTGVIAIVVAILADQASKQVALASFSAADPIRVLPVFDLTLAWNRGVSFGMFGGGDVSPLVFFAIALAICAFLAWQMAKSETALLAAGYGLIVGGALGNALDRLIHGAVVDFLSVHWRGWAFPVFNIADAAITLGVILVIIDSLWPKRASTTSSE